MDLLGVAVTAQSICCTAAAPLSVPHVSVWFSSSDRLWLSLTLVSPSCCPAFYFRSLRWVMLPQWINPQPFSPSSACLHSESHRRNVWNIIHIFLNRLTALFCAVFRFYYICVVRRHEVCFQPLSFVAARISFPHVTHTHAMSITGSLSILILKNKTWQQAGLKAL